MKKMLFLGLCVASVVIGCKSETKTTSQAGVYKLDKQVINDGKSELIKSTANGDLQYKIYTPEGYFVIAMAKDSTVYFGTGSYTQADKSLTETNIYNSLALDTVSDVKLDITTTEKGYTQLIPEITVSGTKYKFTEDYTTIATTGTSALDGIWHQTKNLVVSGKDTADKTYNEYKVYQGGHFMWATRYMSDTAAKKMTNLVGHGTFTLNSDALTEQLDFSSLKGAVGKYDIKVKFNGADEYTQETADTTNKTVGFKTYKRIKK